MSWFRFGNTADRIEGTPEQTTGPVPGTGRSKSGKRKKSNKSEVTVTKTFRGKRNLYLLDSATCTKFLYGGKNSVHCSDKL